MAEWMAYCKVSIGTLCGELCKNGWTDQDAVWDLDLVGSRKHMFCRNWMTPHPKLIFTERRILQRICLAQYGCNGQCPSFYRKTSVLSRSWMDGDTEAIYTFDLSYTALLACVSEFGHLQNKGNSLANLYQSLNLAFFGFSPWQRRPSQACHTERPLLFTTLWLWQLRLLYILSHNHAAGDALGPRFETRPVKRQLIKVYGM